MSCKARPCRLRKQSGRGTPRPYRDWLFGGEEFAADGFDGANSACGGWDGDLEGFGELTGSDNLEAALGFFLAHLEGSGKEKGVYDRVFGKLVEAIEVDGDRLRLDNLETVLTLDERSPADQGKLTALKPKRDNTAGFLTFLTTSDGVTADTRAKASSKALFGSFDDFREFG